MVKVEFKNAVAKDTGYGLDVNGKSLQEIISTVLGTRVRSRAGYGSGLPYFESSCCNVTVIIDPQPVTTLIDTDTVQWDTVADMEEDLQNELIEKENGEAES